MQNLSSPHEIDTGRRGDSFLQRYRTGNVRYNWRVLELSTPTDTLIFIQGGHQTVSVQHASSQAGFLPFCLEDGSGTFLRNVNVHLSNYTELCLMSWSRRSNSRGLRFKSEPIYKNITPFKTLSSVLLKLSCFYATQTLPVFRFLCNLNFTIFLFVSSLNFTRLPVVVQTRLGTECNTLIKQP